MSDKPEDKKGAQDAVENPELLKLQIKNLQKTVDSLKDSNVALKTRLDQLEEAGKEEKIQMIVEKSQEAYTREELVPMSKAQLDAIDLTLEKQKKAFVDMAHVEYNIDGTPKGSPQPVLKWDNKKGEWMQ